MAHAAGLAWRVLAVAGIVAYPVLIHLGVSAGASDPLRIALLAAPMVAAGCWILLRSPHRVIWAALLGVALGAMLVLGQNPAALYGVPHAAAYLFMLWLFGRTLFAGREPIVTRFARHARGASLAPEMERYTRSLTLAWCAFFAAQLAASALLLRSSTLETWSLFINVLNFPLVALMFAGDYVYRMIRFGDSPSSIANALLAYAKDRASGLHG